MSLQLLRRWFLPGFVKKGRERSTEWRKIDLLGGAAKGGNFEENQDKILETLFVSSVAISCKLIFNNTDLLYSQIFCLFCQVYLSNAGIPPQISLSLLL